jgi:type IV pilus assembly protein PilC
MAEYVVKLADERGRIQEQVQTAGSAEELRSRFSQAGYYVYSVRPRGMRGVGGSRKKANLEAFIIFNQQFLTLIRAGLPIVGSLDMLVKGQKNPAFRAQLENVAARVRTGESLSGAFEAQGGFPLIYTTTLLASFLPADFALLPQEADSFPALSLPADHHGGRAIRLPDQFRGAALRLAL